MPMGTGKGDVDIYTASVKKGRVLFELTGLPQAVAQEALLKAAKKLPVKARFVMKGDIK